MIALVALFPPLEAAFFFTWTLMSASLWPPPYVYLIDFFGWRA
jgi:hypothetical protein